MQAALGTVSAAPCSQRAQQRTAALGAAPMRLAPPQQLLQAGTLRKPRRLTGGASRSRLSVCAAKKQQFSSFDDMIKNADKPLLVDFYARWCGPCQMMGQTLDAVAPSVKDRVTFVKVDSDKYGELAGRWGVQGLPTLILFKNGQAVDRLEGMLPQPQFEQWIKART